ncbi:uncharacterized protein VTP21DRAFT_11271 [Calcarisporiella thermophila]|uniref:uncharacterized protein n=1 Tax=Calcarisporiella thermophila TaxID=911321 RepID=UPI003743A7F4
MPADIQSEYALSKLGEVLDGDLELLDVIGSGSYGFLYLARSISNDTYYAVKRLSKYGLSSAELEYQRVEHSLHSRLHHSNIVKLDRVFDTYQDTWIVMELCAGGDLFDLIESSGSTDLEQAEAVSMFGQIVEAVYHAHSRGVYHRDIKPENILVAEDGTLKLADFGLATEERYVPEYGYGTLAYIAPEMHEDTKTAGVVDAAKGDVWSLGVLLLAMLTGKHPWQEAHERDPIYARYLRDSSVLSEMFPHISQRVMRLVMALLTVNPLHRPDIMEAKKLLNSLSLATEGANGSEEDEGYGSLKSSIAPGSLGCWSEIDEEGEMDFSQPVSFEDDWQVEDGVFVCEL